MMVKKSTTLIFTAALIILLASITTSINENSEIDVDRPDYGINSKYGCLVPQSLDIPDIYGREIDSNPKSSLYALNGVVEGYTIKDNGPIWEGDSLNLKKIPLKEILVSDALSKVYTNSLGKFLLPTDAKYGLLFSMPYREKLTVIEYSGKPDYFPIEVFDSENSTSYDLIYPNKSLDIPQINVYYHTQRANEWLGQELDHIYVRTNDKEVKCNAFAHIVEGYMTFGQEVDTGVYHCPNTAYSSVIIHEYGHMLLEQYYPFPACPTKYGPCNFTDYYGYHEAIGDTFSSLVEGNKCIAKDLLGKGKGCLRDVDEDWIFPVPMESSPHDRGRPLSGSFWDLRKLLIEEYGEEKTNEILPKIFLYTVKENDRGLYENITDVIIEADVEFYGGIHRDEIVEAFTSHGFKLS